MKDHIQLNIAFTWAPDWVTNLKTQAENFINTFEKEYNEQV